MEVCTLLIYTYSQLLPIKIMCSSLSLHFTGSAITEYVLEIQEESGAGPTGMVTVASDVNSYTFTSLQPDTLYR